MIFRLYWQTGLITIIEGKDIVSAFNNSIYRENHLSIISFYKDETVNTKHKWDNKLIDWVEIFEGNEIIQSTIESNFTQFKKMVKM